MAKKKVVKKTKSTPRTKSKGFGGTNYAVEHDFIIIVGGALIVMILVVFFVLGF